MRTTRRDDDMEGVMDDDMEDGSGSESSNRSILCHVFC